MSSKDIYLFSTCTPSQSSTWVTLGIYYYKIETWKTSWMCDRIGGNTKKEEIGPILSKNSKVSTKHGTNL